MPDHPENLGVQDVKVEEGEVDAYMDDERAHDSAPTREEQVQYLKARLNVIKDEYKTFMLHKKEAEGTNRMDILGNLRDGFRKNYAARKWIVRRLREMGETVNDPFIPG